VSASELVGYAASLRDRLAGAGVSVPQLDALVGAAGQLAALVDHPETITEAAWQQAVQRWEQARATVLRQLPRALLGALAEIPGLADALGDLERLARTGVQAELDLGPVHLAVSSATLYLQPPPLPGGVVLPPVPIGPFAVGAVEARIAAPFGGGSPALPGGGALARLTGTAEQVAQQAAQVQQAVEQARRVGADVEAAARRVSDALERGWGGRLQIPLPPVVVDAAAVLAVAGGAPTFLAVLGVSFVPPIQLSFGFSLDRVGGIVGVNRALDTEALRGAVRTGAAGDVLFQVRPPADPAAFATDLDRLFPRRAGSHIVGPSLKLSWLSFGPAGSLVSLDVAVVVELPAGRVAVLGVARMSIPGLPWLFTFRLDVLGLLDPVEQLLTIDASLVDSSILGVFEVSGDAALRLSWGSQSYVVVSVGGFFPGFDPSPAKLPPLRRVGMATTVPGGVLQVRAEGYFAVTGNSVQLGGRWQVRISLIIEASGFLEVDALVQFRPFRFEARIAAGFDVSVAGFDFASVRLSGSISGPGPIVLHGELSISVFLFEISWDQTLTLGSGPADTLGPPPVLLDLLAAEFTRPASLRAAQTSDPEVVLAPRPAAPETALVPPTGSLQLAQRLAPLGIPVRRLLGQPLPAPQGARIAGSGADVLDSFAPGSFLVLSTAESVNRPAFEDLPAGRVLTPADPDPAAFPGVDEERTLRQVVLRTGGGRVELLAATLPDLTGVSAIVAAASAGPALSDQVPVLTAVREGWTVLGAGSGSFASATAAHEFARGAGGVAVPKVDQVEPVALAGVL
jgi:hypothetical protein